ncbi:MAG: DMT family transporter [Proteobacteria bacterium]|nr:DMT family transporter [Pseudomonadota bacterium]
MPYVTKMTSPSQPITPLAAGQVRLAVPLGMILLLGSLWGLSFSFSKMAANGGVHAVAYTFWQGLAAGLIVAAICRLRRTRIPLGRVWLRYYFTIGLTGIALPNVNLVAAIAHLPAGVMVLTIPFVPLITYGIAIGLKMERFTPLRFAGVLCGLAGVALIVLPKASLPDPAAAPWFLLALATPALYATTNVLAARLRPPDARSLPLAGGMLLAAATLLTPVVFAMDVLYLPSLPMGEAEIGMLGQIAVSSVAYLIFFEVLRMAGPVFMSFTGYIVTLTGIAWGVVLFGESHSPWVWGAACLIFTGLALVNLRRNGGGQPSA